VPTRPLIVVLLALSCSCTANVEDCARLGDKFVELYEAELDDNSRKLSPEVRANAAEAGRSEVVEQCMRETHSKASIERCLKATTMAEFAAC
jgi:hypothetical protein